MKLFWLPFETLAYLVQRFYMWPKKTVEKVGWGFAFFHPRKLGKVVEEKFWQRLVKYTG